MTEFHVWIRAAQLWLAAGHPDLAVAPLRNALRHANRMSPEHRRVTLRALNWTRTAAKATG